MADNRGKVGATGLRTGTQNALLHAIEKATGRRIKERDLTPDLVLQIDLRRIVEVHAAGLGPQSLAEIGQWIGTRKPGDPKE